MKSVEVSAKCVQTEQDCVLTRMGFWGMCNVDCVDLLFCVFFRVGGAEDGEHHCDADDDDDDEAVKVSSNTDVVV